LTNVTLSAPFLTRTCSDGSWYLVSGRLRIVSPIAAMIATSNITAAI